jgi:hypothetical protein
MKTAFLHSLLPWTFGLAPIPMLAVAGDSAPLEVLYEVTLDIDHDGKSDRAVMVREPNGQADLYIYLGSGDEKLDLTKEPAFLKKLTAQVVAGLESTGKGSLVVTYGCGGCSNDWETTLTIVDRGGEFLVAGFTFDWDTRYDMGRCDINFLTGKGVLSDGVGGSKPIKGNFRPIRLADWSDDKSPDACDVDG